MSLNVMSEPTHAEMEFPFPMGGQHAVKIIVPTVRNVTLEGKLSFLMYLVCS